MTDNIEKKDPDQGKVIALYVAFILAAILVMAPIATISFLALLGMIVVMIVIGFLRKEAEKDSLLYNHALYLSRTFWMWQLLLLVGGVIGGYLLFQRYPDLQQILHVVESLSSGQTNTEEFRTIAMMAIASFGPGCLYATYRLLRGFERGIRGYRVAKPKSFF